jgi:hypothetical protein
MLKVLNKKGTVISKLRGIFISLRSQLMVVALVTTLPVKKLDVFVELWGFLVWELGDGVIGVVMVLLISEPKL